MSKIDQNLEFFGFCHHPFHSGKRYSLLLHWSNPERVVENERREWRPLRAQQGGPKEPKMAKFDQNLEYFSFCSHPIDSGNKFSLFIHWSYADRVEQNDRGECGPLGGSIRGSWMAQNGRNWPKYHFFGSYPTHLVNKFPFLSNWSNVGRIVESDDPGGLIQGSWMAPNG